MIVFDNSFSLARGARVGEIIVSWFSLKLEKPPHSPGKTKIEVATQGRVYRGEIDTRRAAVSVKLDEKDDISGVNIDLS